MWSQKELERRAAEMKARLTQTPMSASIFQEQPLSVREASKFWGQSTRATRDHFRKIPGVRVKPAPARKRQCGRAARKYETVLIPPSVLKEEIRKITNGAE